MSAITGSFHPSFIGLDALANTNATLADLNTILPGLDGAALKFYRVALSTDPEERPGKVRPANYHDSLNPILFIQC